MDLRRQWAKVLAAGLFSSLFTLTLFGQSIRGLVVDKASQQPLIGANVSVVDADPIIGTVSDVDGQFVLEGLKPGRYRLECTYLGYSSFVSDNLLVNSARELVIQIELEEAAIEVGEVTVTARQNPSQAVNEAALLSTRSFTAEETQRYAATGNDPSRMALGFPGVQTSRDSRNDIIIRGNNPIGLLWRLEGIDIPNPNHFARIGSSGGGITVFSISMLSTSDFSTGAFPAEYGNAFSGVFDMRFRKGNDQKRGYTFRAGLLGLDLATEGPIKKGRSSYLINYRYSTLGLLNQMGVYLVNPRTDNIFQDLSFNISGKSKDHRLIYNWWGIGGLSDENQRAEDGGPDEWRIFTDYRTYDFSTNMGATGINVSYLLDDKSYLRFSLAYMGQEVGFVRDTLDNSETTATYSDQKYRQNRLTAALNYNTKINKQWYFKTGLLASRLAFDLQHQQLVEDQTRFRSIISADDNSSLWQAYTQVRFLSGNGWTVNGGLHGLYFALNDQWRVEPRIGVQYRWKATQSISFAYGQHSRILPLGNYFILSSDESTFPNADLALLKAQHFILGYDWLIGKNKRFHVEVYYQRMNDVPVSADSSRTYSLLNAVEGYAVEALVSEGTGTNMGVDVSFERFFQDGFQLLLGASVFDATYEPLNGETYSTRYNSNLAANLLIGKEWTYTSGNILQLGFRVLFNAGNRITPLVPDAEVSRFDRNPPEDQFRAFEDRVTPYFRPDFKIAFRRNGPKAAWLLSLDIQNVIGRQNQDAIDYIYDPDLNDWIDNNQSGLTPILSFEIDF